MCLSRVSVGCDVRTEEWGYQNAGGSVQGEWWRVGVEGEGEGNTVVPIEASEGVSAPHRWGLHAGYCH